jgi:hypothetical protein
VLNILVLRQKFTFGLANAGIKSASHNYASASRTDMGSAA